MANVLGYIMFLKDSPLYEYEKPFGVTLPADYEPTADQRLTNLEFDERLLNIKDIRSPGNDLTLDRSGFMLLQRPTAHPVIPDMVTFNAYKGETEQILKDVFKPEYICCWDGRLRRAERLHQNIEVEDLKDKLAGSNPVNLAHVDETIARGHESIQLYLPDELKQKYTDGTYRMRMVNTWRPLIDELEHYPLGVLDYSSLDPSRDLIAYDQVSPVRAKELYTVIARPEHRWYWVSRMRKSELLVFVQYDSSDGGQARCCPHAGFRNINAPPNAPMRESIETRSIVITKV